MTKNVTIWKLVWTLTTVLISNCLTIDPILAVTEQKIVNSESNHQSKLQVLLPLYIYPNWYNKNKYAWKQVITAAKKVSIVAIINPNSGPNNAPPNTDYQQGIKDLHQAGIKLAVTFRATIATEIFKPLRQISISIRNILKSMASLSMKPLVHQRNLIIISNYINTLNPNLIATMSSLIQA